MISWPNYRQVLRKIYDNVKEAIRITPSSDLMDPASRLRISEPYTMYSSKNLHGLGASVMKSTTSGAGASVAYVPDQSAVDLTVGTASGEYAIRQSRHIPYVPGKGIRVQLTELFSTAKANNVQRVGYFDELDGPFFQNDSSGFSIIKRTSTSGTVSDAYQVYQSAWNLDTLDGTGNDGNPSGILLDITKVQLLYIDLLWQGVGNIRFGLKIDGKLLYVHKIVTGNESDSVSFMRPSLPLRYEIRNTGTTASATTLREICCQADSEGGFQIPGLEFGAPNQAYTRTGITTTPTPIMAIRLKSTLASGKTNRATARFMGARARVTGNSDGWFTLHHVHDPTFTGGTWVDGGTDSMVEYNIGVTSLTATINHIVDAGPVQSGQGGQSSTSQAIAGIFNEHGLITMNIDATQSQAFVIYAQAYSGTIDVSVSMNWTEFE